MQDDDERSVPGVRDVVAAVMHETLRAFGLWRTRTSRRATRARLDRIDAELGALREELNTSKIRSAYLGEVGTTELSAVIEPAYFDDALTVIPSFDFAAMLSKLEQPAAANADMAKVTEWAARNIPFGSGQHRVH